MSNVSLHLVAPAEYKMKEVIENSNGFPEKLKVTGWDYSFTSFAHWACGEKNDDPDIVLMFDTAEYPKVNMNENVRNSNKLTLDGLLDCIKTARLKLKSKFIIILSEEKEEDLVFLNELMKFNIHNFYFVKGEFTVLDIEKWIFSKDKMLSDNEQYLISGNANTPKVITKVETKIEVREVEKYESVFKKVIAIYSPTGDGASTYAAYMAHVLSSANKFKVLLIDYNTLKPELKEIFGINCDYTLRDALEAADRRNLSNMVLESFTKEINRNLSILPGVYDLNYLYDNKIEHFEEIIERSKFVYDYVIIDTHPWYDFYSTHSALNSADDVILVTRGNRFSLGTVNRYLESFEKYNDFDIRKFKILINKYSGSDLTSFEIESKLKYPVVGYISDNKLYDINSGFNDPKLFNEHVTVLKNIGIRVKNKKSFIDILSGLSKNNLLKKAGENK